MGYAPKRERFVAIHPSALTPMAIAFGASSCFTLRPFLDFVIPSFHYPPSPIFLINSRHHLSVPYRPIMRPKYFSFLFNVSISRLESYPFTLGVSSVSFLFVISPNIFYVILKTDFLICGKLSATLIIASSAHERSQSYDPIPYNPFHGCIVCSP